MTENKLLDIELCVRRAARTLELLGGDEQFLKRVEEMLHGMKYLVLENAALGEVITRAAGHFFKIDADEYVGKDDGPSIAEDENFKQLAELLADYE